MTYLRHETLDLTGTLDGELVLLGKLIHTKNGDDVLERGGVDAERPGQHWASGTRLITPGTTNLERLVVLLSERKERETEKGQRPSHSSPPTPQRTWRIFWVLVAIS